jgi:hypothetical protein
VYLEGLDCYPYCSYFPSSGVIRVSLSDARIDPNDAWQPAMADNVDPATRKAQLELPRSKKRISPRLKSTERGNGDWTASNVLTSVEGDLSVRDFTLAPSGEATLRDYQSLQPTSKMTPSVEDSLAAQSSSPVPDGEARLLRDDSHQTFSRSPPRDGRPPLHTK